MPYRSSSWSTPIGSGAGEEIVRTISNALSRTFSNPSYHNEDAALSDSSIDEKSTTKASDWHMRDEVKGIAEQTEKDSGKERRLGVTWTNLTVKGIGADAALHENVFSQFNIPTLIKVRYSPVESSRRCSRPLPRRAPRSTPSIPSPTTRLLTCNRRVDKSLHSRPSSTTAMAASSPERCCLFSVQRITSWTNAFTDAQQVDLVPAARRSSRCWPTVDWAMPKSRAT